VREVAKIVNGLRNYYDHLPELPVENGTRTRTFDRSGWPVGDIHERYLCHRGVPRGADYSTIQRGLLTELIEYLTTMRDLVGEEAGAPPV
jgi:hypothetical protein